MAFNGDMFGSGLGHLLGGLFGHSGKPYHEAQKQYQDYYNRSTGRQQPYDQAGRNALQQQQEWLDKQKDPSKFINDTMNQYTESPYSHYLQQQSLRAGQNEASSDGTLGSTPMMQQLQQNAANISQQGQNDWLNHVLGINTQYGQGQQNMINVGQNAANNLSNLDSQMGSNMAEQQYNKTRAKQQDFWNTIGGGIGMLGGFFGV